jgi:hypothetical protein
MAKGNPLLGTLRRSIGDVTFFRRNGEQISRARIRQIANPRTDAQTIRRLAFSSASKTAQQLRGIVDHSFQGIKYGQTSVNHFVSRLAKEIGSTMEGAVVDPSTAPFGTAPVLPYAAGGVAAGAKALISSGDLASVPFDFLSGSPYGFLIGNTLEPTWNMANAKVSDFETIFGVPSTDQLTFIFGAPVELDYISESELFYGVRFSVARLNFMPAAEFTGENLFEEVSSSSSYFRFFSPFVDWDRSSASLQNMEFIFSQQRLIAFSGDVASRMDPTGTFAAGDVCLAGCITSRFENNAWRRSTTRLIQNPKTITQSAVAYEQNYAYNDIMSTIELSVPSKKATEDRYLNKEPNA